MERSTFEERLREATERVVVYTRTMVQDELPDNIAYLVRPNSSYCGNLQGDEIVFPEDSLPLGKSHLPPKSAEELVDYLWRRGGRVPAWIDVPVASADTGTTYVALICCGRFTAG